MNTPRAVASSPVTARATGRGGSHTPRPFFERIGTMETAIKNTPIGQLLNMGLSDREIGEVTGVTASAVSKWRTGANNIHGVRQTAAKAYLAGLKEKPVIKKAAEPSDTETRLFMAEVPQSKVGKFNAVLNMLGINAVDME